MLSISNIDISKYNIISFDLWDTLIRRIVHPDDIKLNVSRYLLTKYGMHIKCEYMNTNQIFKQRKLSEFKIGSQNLKIGFDDEYEIEEVWKDVLTEILRFTDTKFISTLLEDVTNYEINLECFVTYPDYNIRKFIEKLSDKYIILISDFYIGKNKLEKIIKKNYPQLNFNDIYVSCDYKLNKKSGRLYELIPIKNEKILHIGDNLTSDYNNSISKGFSSIFYQNKNENHKIDINTKLYHLVLKCDYYEVISNLINQIFGKNDLSIYASILCNTIIYIINYAEINKIKKVYYLSREGEILYHLHQMILKINPKICDIECELLEVSRLATYGPSIKDINLNELMRLWRMYPNQSLEEFIISLGLDLNKYQNYFYSKNIDIKTKVNIHDNGISYFEEIFKDKDLKHSILSDLKESRESLILYLSSKNIHLDSKEDIFIFDIGWRGTIQDNLALIYKDVKWSGLYLGLFRFLNEQPKNTIKDGIIFNENDGELTTEFLPQAPIEMLFNSLLGSVLKYKIINEKIQVIRDEISSEYTFQKDYIDQIQSIAKEKINEYFINYKIRAIDISGIRKRLYTDIRNLLLSPSSNFAKAYFKVEHDERFGNNKVYKFNNKIPISKIILNIYNPFFLKIILKDSIKNSFWPNAYIKYNKLTKLRNIYIKFIEYKKHLKKFIKKITFSNKIINSSNDLNEIYELPFSKYIISEENITYSKYKENSDEFFINWFIPDIGYGSGGHFTIIRMISYFQSLGIKNRIYISEKSIFRTVNDLREFIRVNYKPLTDVELYLNDSIILNADINIATYWETVYSLKKKCKVGLNYYFIQDFEPYFYTMSSKYIFAENTYKMGLYGVTASPWLKAKVNAYGMEAFSFKLGYDSNIYYLDDSVCRDPNKVSVYMRPSTDRRGTELLIASLNLVKVRRPQTKINIFGTSNINGINLNYDLKFCGLLSEGDLRIQYSSSSIVLLTSLTNYSLVPIEAMACGAVVVDVNVESTNETFENDAPIQLVETTPEKIADKILSLLDDQSKLKYISNASLSYSKNYDWKDTFITVEEGIFKYYFKNKIINNRIPDGIYKTKTGNVLFEIKNNQKTLFFEDKLDSSPVIEKKYGQIPILDLLSLPYSEKKYY